MTTEPKPTPEKQNSPASPDPEETRPNPADENTLPPTVRATGFFSRVQRELKSEPIHPSEAEEIVVMEEDGDRNPPD